MAAITIKLDTANLVRGLDRLQANWPSAVARALNRAIVSARVVMASAVATDMGLKVTDVKEQIGIIEAQAPDRLVAGLTASATRIPLINFNARGPEPSLGKGGGVTARMPGGAGSYPHAFIATMPTGHRGVFERKRGGRLPIVELRGPSIRHVFEKHTAEGLARGQESLVKNLQSEIRYAIRNSAA